MAQRRQVTIEITGDASSASKAFRRTVQDAEATEGRMSKIGKSLKSAFAFTPTDIANIAQGFGSMVSSFTNAARESEKVSKVTEQIIKSTGQAAGLTATEVGKLATALSNKTAIDDEQIQTGQNLLLTFKGIRNEVGAGNDVFNRASEAMLDLGTVFGSTDAAAMQLGKALNDPVKGMGALAKAGVTFSEDQKKAIKAFAESNDLLGAQKIILAEVESQVGGTAAATATNSDRMRVAFGNLQETIGAKLLPVIERFSGWMVDTAIPAMERFAGWVNREIVPALRDLGAWVQREVVPRLMAIVDFFEEHWAGVRQIIGLVVDYFRDRIQGMISVAQGLINFIAGVFTGDWKRAWDGLTQAATNIFRAMFGNLPDIAMKAVGALGSGLLAVGKKIGEYLGNGILAAIEFVVNKIVDTLDAALGPLFNFGNVQLGRIGASGGGGATRAPARAPVGVGAPNQIWDPTTGMFRSPVGVLAPTRPSGASVDVGDDARARVVANARAMLGRTETDPALVRSLGRDLQGEANAWCQLYVNNVFKTAGIPLPNNGSEGTRNSFADLVKAGMKSKDPVVGGLAYKTRPGDWKGHVGVVTAYDPATGMVTTIEGNAGDKVAQKTSNRKSWDLGFIDPTRGGTAAAARAQQQVRDANPTRVERTTAKATEQTARGISDVDRGLQLLRDQGMAASDAARMWERAMLNNGNDASRAYRSLGEQFGRDIDELTRAVEIDDTSFAGAVAVFASAVAVFAGAAGAGGGGGRFPMIPTPGGPIIPGSNVLDPIFGPGANNPIIVDWWTKNGWIPARAAGGPVSAGSPYVVGERGPELFMPGSSGSIVPNHALGGTTIEVHVYGSVMTDRDLTAAVVDGLRREGLVRPDGAVVVRR